MNSQVIFYALNQKFLDSKDKVPEQAQQVMYYSLSIGHHVGVIDCLKRILTCPLADYRHWIGQLPDGEAQRKMAGLMKFGEIVIDSSHTKLLGQAFSDLSAGQDAYPDWTDTLLAYLRAIEQETALYLMVKRIDD
ncbi:formate hydrogenlyase maturation protein HycH [Brenneria goodwinii]|uniref:Formate hydrogenlyase maturation protein HycH n=1 Tax=Brenneria goodwinii TaxID=1109412 RepID=A0A0G4K2J7_9GAMM|nr:formate hydrogenlyase maturation HycH family protein [Brenneria goodwinii]ATA24540.1 formate hydrogenlyase maturation protein HycH [Brenneria goodwinii]RLM19993.1 formate hydrogenlyase maturation protein HycH [Brenneria goodwinii]CPR21402.1 Formate hydrogenlyase maturation protein hycH [Brenneria goodwinii]